MAETNKDFCCLIITGFGEGEQSGLRLRDHLRGSGMDAYVTTPSGSQPVRIEQEHWVHGVRMEYLALRHTYRRIAVIGLSVGGWFVMHLLDLKPAALILVNAPSAERQRGLSRIYRADFQARIHGALRAQLGRRQLVRLMDKTRACHLHAARCPALVLQTQDDCVCDPPDAEIWFKRLTTKDKMLRYYPEGGHDVLASDTVLAVCSDIFQFCSRIQAQETDKL